mmetsp:Transcript_36330/g.85236  ORF Transcript_36330/g.85236 Transcript_36330/m.85236 type:complete len:145 (-) Transcript_36330:1436-1870(-)
MTRVVRPTEALSSASCTTPSLSESSALVASSSRRILGFRTSARAIAMRCFCPPDSCAPLSPQNVLYPCGSFDTKSCALACLAASSASAWVRGEPSALPYAIFSMTVHAKRRGSCDTTAICLRSQNRSSALRSTPSRVTLPASGS